MSQPLTPAERTAERVRKLRDGSAQGAAELPIAAPASAADTPESRTAARVAALRASPPPPAAPAPPAQVPAPAPPAAVVPSKVEDGPTWHGLQLQRKLGMPEPPMNYARHMPQPLAPITEPEPGPPPPSAPAEQVEAEPPEPWYKRAVDSQDTRRAVEAAQYRPGDGDKPGWFDVGPSDPKWLEMVNSGAGGQVAIENRERAAAPKQNIAEVLGQFGKKPTQEEFTARSQVLDEEARDPAIATGPEILAPTAGEAAAIAALSPFTAAYGALDSAMRHGQALRDDGDPEQQSGLGAVPGLPDAKTLPGSGLGKLAFEAPGTALGWLGAEEWRDRPAGRINTPGLEGVRTLVEGAGSALAEGARKGWDQASSDRGTFTENMATALSNVPSELAHLALSFAAIPYGLATWAGSSAPTDEKLARAGEMGNLLAEETGKSVGYLRDPSVGMREQGFVQQLLNVWAIEGAASKLAAGALGKAEARVADTAFALSDKLAQDLPGRASVMSAERAARTAGDTEGLTKILVGEAEDVLNTKRMLRDEAASQVMPGNAGSAQAYEQAVNDVADADMLHKAAVQKHAAAVADKAAHDAALQKTLFESLPELRAAEAQIAVATKDVSRAERAQAALQAVLRTPSYYLTGGALAATDTLGLMLAQLRKARRGDAVATANRRTALRTLTQAPSELAPATTEAFIRAGRGVTHDDLAIFEAARVLAPNERQTLANAMDLTWQVESEVLRGALATRKLPNGQYEWALSPIGESKMRAYSEAADRLDDYVRRGVDPLAVDKANEALTAALAEQQAADAAYRMAVEAHDKLVAQHAPGLYAIEAKIAEANQALSAGAQKVPRNAREMVAAEGQAKRAEAAIARLEARRTKLTENIPPKALHVEPRRVVKVAVDKRVAAAQAEVQRLESVPAPLERLDKIRAESVALRAKADSLAGATVGLNRYGKDLMAWVRENIDRRGGHHARIGEQILDPAERIRWATEEKAPYLPDPSESTGKWKASFDADAAESSGLLDTVDQSKLKRNKGREMRLSQAQREEMLGHNPMADAGTWDKVLGELINEHHALNVLDQKEALAKTIAITAEEFGARKLQELSLMSEERLRGAPLGSLAEADAYALRERPSLSTVSPIDAQWVQVPNEPRVHGALAGKFVPVDEWVHLTNLTELPAQLNSITGRIMRLWKGAKTILDAAVHSRNFITGWILQAPMAGLNLMTPKGIASFRDAVRNLATDHKSPEFLALQATGRLDVASALGEALATQYMRRALGAESPWRAITSMLTDGMEYGKAMLTKSGRERAALEREARGALGLANTDGLSTASRATWDAVRAEKPFSRLPGEQLDRLKSSSWRALKALAWETPGKIYQLNDTLVRTAIGIHRMRHYGESAEQAMRVADRFAINYSDVNGAVQMMRAPVVPQLSPAHGGTPGKAGRAAGHAGFFMFGRPFITYPVQAVKLYREWARSAPLEAASIQVVADALSNMNLAAMQGYTPQAVESFERQTGQLSVGRYFPEFGTGSGGQLRNINAQFLSPISALGTGGTPGFGAGATNTPLGPLIGDSLYSSVRDALKTGRDGLGRQRVDSTANVPTQMQQVLKTVYQTAMPGWAPGGTRWESIQNALNGKTDAWGNERTLAEAALGALGGIGTKRAGPGLVGSQLLGLSSYLRAVNAEVRARNNAGEISDEEATQEIRARAQVGLQQLRDRLVGDQSPAAMWGVATLDEMLAALHGEAALDVVDALENYEEATFENRRRGSDLSLDGRTILDDARASAQKRREALSSGAEWPQFMRDAFAPR